MSGISLLCVFQIKSQFHGLWTLGTSSVFLAWNVRSYPCPYSSSIQVTLLSSGVFCLFRATACPKRVGRALSSSSLLSVTCPVDDELICKALSNLTLSPSSLLDYVIFRLTQHPCRLTGFFIIHAGIY